MKPTSLRLGAGIALGLVALVVIWGLSIPLTKLALAETGPLTLTALRYAVAVLCFAGVLAGRRPPPAGALMRMAGLGVLGIGIGQVAQALGVQRANASVATIISALIPLLVVVFAVLAVLLLGLWNMMRGTSPNTSQKLMRWRVGLQFFAILVIMAFFLLTRWRRTRPWSF